MSQRTQRIDELLRQEISQLLVREVADPGVGFATVTQVETSADLAHARVWVSVIGSPLERQMSIEALQRAMPFVRHELGKRLRIRRIPKFSVRLDESIERGSRVIHILNDLEAVLDPDPATPGESLPTPAPRLPHEGDAPIDALLASLPPSSPRPAGRSGHGPGTSTRSGAGAGPRRNAGTRNGAGSGTSTGRRADGQAGRSTGSGGTGSTGPRKPGARRKQGAGQ